MNKKAKELIEKLNKLDSFKDNEDLLLSLTDTIDVFYLKKDINGLEDSKKAKYYKVRAMELFRRHGNENTDNFDTSGLEDENDFKVVKARPKQKDFLFENVLTYLHLTDRQFYAYMDSENNELSSTFNFIWNKIYSYWQNASVKKGYAEQSANRNPGIENMLKKLEKEKEHFLKKGRDTSNNNEFEVKVSVVE